MSRALWHSFFLFDTRAVAEVDADVRAEFESHIALIEDELHSAGLTRAEAAAEARRRFGDVQRLSRAGRNIKLGERIMLQRINFGLLLVLAGVVVWMGVRGSALQRESLAALQQVSARLDGLAERQAPHTSHQPAPRSAFIEGLVKNPGTYVLQPGMTVRRFIVAAGGLDQAFGSVNIVITRNGPDEKAQKISVQHAGFTWPDGSDIELQPDDIVTVRQQPRPDPGLVYVTGMVARPGPFQLPENGLTLRRLVDSCNPQPGAAFVHVERADETDQSFKLDDLRTPGGPDLPLVANDRISLLSEQEHSATRPVGGMVAVAGAVARPGNYRLPADMMTLASAIEAAGGPSEGGRRASISRMSAGVHKDTNIELNEPKARNLPLFPGDRVRVWSHPVLPEWVTNLEHPVAVRALSDPTLESLLRQRREWQRVIDDALQRGAGPDDQTLTRAAARALAADASIDAHMKGGATVNDADLPPEWKRYQPGPHITGPAQTDEVLKRLVDDRRT